MSANLSAVPTNNNTTEDSDLEQLFKTQTDNLLKLQELNKKQLEDRKNNDLLDNDKLNKNNISEQQRLNMEITKRYNEASLHLEESHLTQTQNLKKEQQQIRQLLKQSSSKVDKDKSNEPKNTTVNETKEPKEPKYTDPYEFKIKKQDNIFGSFTIGKNVFYDKTSKKFLFFDEQSVFNLDFKNTENATIFNNYVLLDSAKQNITKQYLLDKFSKFKTLKPAQQKNNDEYKFIITIPFSEYPSEHTIGQTAFYDERTKHVLCFKNKILFTLTAKELKKRKSDIVPTKQPTTPEDIFAILNALAAAQKEPKPVAQGGQSNQTKARRRFHRKKYTKRNHQILPKSIIYSGIVEFSAISSSLHRRPRSRKLRDKNV